MIMLGRYLTKLSFGLPKIWFWKLNMKVVPMIHLFGDGEFGAWLLGYFILVFFYQRGTVLNQ